MVNLNVTKTVAQLLLESARQDQAACTLLSTGAGIKDAVVGFHAQQAIEKSLKAVLSAQSIEFRRTHDLVTYRVHALDVVTRVMAWAELQITHTPKA